MQNVQDKDLEEQDTERDQEATEPRADRGPAVRLLANPRRVRRA